MSVCEYCHSKIHNLIKKGFIQQKNKFSKEKTLNALKYYHKNINSNISPKNRTHFEITEKMCRFYDNLPMQNKRLIFGIFKISVPRSFLVLKGKTISLSKLKRLNQVSYVKMYVKQEKPKVFKKDPCLYSGK